MRLAGAAASVGTGADEFLPRALARVLTQGGLPRALARMLAQGLPRMLARALAQDCCGYCHGTASCPRPRVAMLRPRAAQAQWRDGTQ
uniref:Uncharacterized protein n=1 Tax=Burkholderia sp. B8(2020) TaxID=2713619 RepID=A0A6G6CX27_9BURK|nr:hypothetical protein [Burkholderia sp. B8(2020)]